jgi:DNA-binding HxlR family transcriptional regulator
VSRRSYGQYCAVAKTLDLIGERWTLLVIRELAFGPKRYTDVLSGVPGMNTTLLAQRLRDLEADGLVARRTLPPPAASTVYELTDSGVELAWALLPLVHWGARHALGPRADDELFRVEWPLLALSASVDPGRITGVDATYEFRVGGSVGHVVIRDGRLRVGSGPATEADVTLTADAETFVAVGTGKLAAHDAVASGRMTVEGDPEAAAVFASIFSDLRAPAWDAPRPDVAGRLTSESRA